MRFLSRISSWWKQPSRRAPVRVDVGSTHKLPSTTAQLFRERLCTVMEEARKGRRAVASVLDPTIAVLAVPRTSSASRSASLWRSAGVDDALALLEDGVRARSTVTWSSVSQLHLADQPSPDVWAAEHGHWLEDEGMLVFFVDVDAVAMAVCAALESAGLSAVAEDDGVSVRVSDGRFETHLFTAGVLGTALWTGIGPAAAIARVAQEVPADLRASLALLRGLERRFSTLRFDVRGESIFARNALGSTRIAHATAAHAIRQSGGGVDAWLSRVHVEDLDEDNGKPLVLLRSPAYLRAYPDALSVAHEGAAEVAVRRLADGRARPVLVRSDDPPGRFEFYKQQAVGDGVAITGSLFVVDQGRRGGISRAVCVVGDKAASLALSPSTSRAALSSILPEEERVRVRAFSENTVCFSTLDASPELLAEAQRRVVDLEVDLFGERSDPLSFDQEMTLPRERAGQLELAVVPQAYFMVRDQARERADLGRGHTDYLRGLGFELLGRSDLALPAFERAVRAASTDGEMNLALGRTLSSLGDHTRAVPFLERAADALPEHAEASNALGLALYRSGLPARARTAFQRAVRLAPDEAGFFVNLGRTCCDEQLFEEAKAALEQALRLEPTSAEAHATMAILMHRTGDRSLALRHAREALAEDPADDTVGELMKIFEEDS